MWRLVTPKDREAPVGQPQQELVQRGYWIALAPRRRTGRSNCRLFHSIEPVVVKPQSVRARSRRDLVIGVLILPTDLDGVIALDGGEVLLPIIGGVRPGDDRDIPGHRHTVYVLLPPK